MIGVTLPVDDGLSTAEYVELARLADRCGYDTVLAGEVAGPEVFSLLGLIAAHTSRIRIGSGVVGTYPRSPVLTAMGFATLASYAPGRVLAGVGVSSPLIVERWHGKEFTAPLATMREFVTVMREVWSGAPVRHDGDRFRIDGFRSGLVPPEPVPVLLAAMNPGMLRLAGGVADVAFLTWTPPEEIGGKIAMVREGEREAGRPPGTVRIAMSFWAYSGPRQEQAMERMRRFVLQYAMVPTHRSSFVASFPAVGDAVAAWESGDRQAALRTVPDATVRTMCVLGDGADVAQRVHALHDAGVDLPIALTAGAEPGDVDGPQQTVAGLAAALGL
ncbi:MAG: LLM class flavin-dependent oxidoreductase [Pseudonocardiaceae bacterium]|nr:LLM class flavin-dependent oxidoreductase [Pseudonocardiaceae bacterium]